MHRGGVGGREAHAGELVAQVVLQALRRGCRGRSSSSSSPPLLLRAAGRLADAVEVVALGAVLPVVALGGAELGAVDAGRLVGAPSPPGSAARSDSRSPARSAGVGALGERLERRRRVFLGLEEGVLLEHLLDFLVQLERRQLQQPDRLLQLRRQRQVLREADLKVGFMRAHRALHAEVLAEVDLAHVGVVDDLVGRALRRARCPR